MGDLFGGVLGVYFLGDVLVVEVLVCGRGLLFIVCFFFDIGVIGGIGLDLVLGWRGIGVFYLLLLWLVGVYIC